MFYADLHGTLIEIELEYMSEYLETLNSALEEEQNELSNFIEEKTNELSEKDKEQFV